MTRKSKRSLTPGSPQWWSSRSQPSENKSRGPGRPATSFDKIIVAALEAVDAVGPQAFNMRMLAERLGSGTATLYRHVASKAEILAYVVDRVLGELDSHDRGATETTWQQTCTRSAESFYRLLRAHPNVVPLVVSQVPVGPNGLRLRERVIAVLLNSGFAPRLAARAYTTIAHYVIGFVAQQHAAGAPESSQSTDLLRFYQELDAKLFPATVKVAEYLPGTSADDEFHFGLNLVIAGLDLERRGPLVAKKTTK